MLPDHIRVIFQDLGLLGPYLLWIATTSYWLAVERPRRKKAEQELRDVEAEHLDERRRSEGPRLELISISFSNEEGHIEVLNHLTAGELKTGAFIILELNNRGSSVFKVRTDRKPPEGFGRTENGIEFDNSITFLYRFDGSKRGVRERVRLDFQTESGFKTHHIYEYVHGAHTKVSFELVDPA